MTFTTNQIEKIMTNYGNGWVQLLYTEKIGQMENTIKELVWEHIVLYQVIL